MNPRIEGPESDERTEIDGPAAIVQALAEGRDPRTGTKLVGEGPWSSPDVIRALFLAGVALQREAPTARPRPETARPAAAGTPWTPEEDARLKREFESTTDLAGLAERHARTRGAISARLVRLGLLPPTNGRPG